MRWLSPLDFECVAASLSRTGRLVVAHEANLTGGFGAEIAARAAKECFWDLDVPVSRVALPDTRVPAAPVLQESLFPGAERIANALRETAGS
jgi:pyruvate/2-oxoglutarate/acetoin dehydrogenase E1 component